MPTPHSAEPLGGGGGSGRGCRQLEGGGKGAAGAGRAVSLPCSGAAAAERFPPPPARATSPRQGSLRCYKGVGVSASELSPEAARWRGAGSRGSGRGEKSERNSTGQGVTCC